MRQKWEHIQNLASHNKIDRKYFWTELPLWSFHSNTVLGYLPCDLIYVIGDDLQPWLDRTQLGSSDVNDLVVQAEERIKYIV